MIRWPPPPPVHELRSPHGRVLAVGGGRTRLMGVLNVTPDSFSDGGRFVDPAAAAAHARAMVEAGAEVLDIGGESTRPGHRKVPPGRQCARILPVIEALRAEPAFDAVSISVDTTRAAVAAAVLDAGADWINDTSALLEDGALGPLCARRRCPVVLMHRFDPPRRPSDADSAAMLEALRRGLEAALGRAVAAGIDPARVVLDPGIGFGTRAEDVPAILAAVAKLRVGGRPVLYGPSRKSFLAQWTGRGIDERLAGTAGAVAVAVLQGAEIIRVHDVAAMRDVARICEAAAAAGHAAMAAGSGEAR